MVNALYSSSEVISQNICFLYTFFAIILIIASFNFSLINRVFMKTVYAGNVIGFRKNIVTIGNADCSLKGFRVLRLLLRF
jgi:hypothetical protein